MDRISTGIESLDRILGGGLPRHAVHILSGVPGTGKTTLAQRIAFSNGTAERPVLYLTTLSEPLAKLLTYLQELDFTDVDRIGTEIVYEGLDDEIRTRPSELPARLFDLVKEHRPGLIVIDSFKAIGDVVPDTAAWRRIVFDVARVLASYDATAILVGEYGPGQASLSVEFAVADGVIELCRLQRGSSDERFLRVAKLRGSRFLDGDHAFTIGRDGLRVFPRLVGPHRPPPYAVNGERLRSGIDGLDGMIQNGWLRGTSTLVVGASGAGKTLLGLHFLRQGAEDGEPSLLVGFQESPVQLRREIDSLGWDGAALLAPGHLDILYRSPVELQIDTIVQELFARIERDGVKRVVIDALGDLERSAADPRRFFDYLYALTQHFASHDVASMLILEEEPPRGPLAGSAGAHLLYVSDNLLRLEMELGSDLLRTVRILKSRGSAHDGRRRALRITEQGLEVLPG
jgi:circadian clock protein KaiC